MELKISDLIEIFEVPERKIIKWLKEKELPFYKINNQYRFNKAELHDWIIKNRINVSDKIFKLSMTDSPVLISRLIQKGGVHYGIEGKSVNEIIKNSVKLMPSSRDLSKKTIVACLLQREEMMPTAIGRGIAIPHPRNPIISHTEDECITLCFLKKNIDYNAIDGLPVHSLFIILSANPKRHLEILSKISYLCLQDRFLDLLKKRASIESIMKFITSVEEDWTKKKS
jgi:nitrogen PTS system EIIA component